MRVGELRGFLFRILAQPQKILHQIRHRRGAGLRVDRVQQRIQAGPRQQVAEDRLRVFETSPQVGQFLDRQVQQLLAVERRGVDTEEHVGDVLRLLGEPRRQAGQKGFSLLYVARFHDHHDLIQPDELVVVFLVQLHVAFVAGHQIVAPGHQFQTIRRNPHRGQRQQRTTAQHAFRIRRHEACGRAQPASFQLMHGRSV